MNRHNAVRTLFILIGILLIFDCIAKRSSTTELVQDSTGIAITKWVSSNAIPLRSIKAGSGFADLQPLKKVFQGVRIVGLGEATHGTHEFFQFKHRMVEFLVKEMGFRLFALESGYVSCSDLNDYVMGKSNDGAKALESQGFWPWDTEEMREMVNWMRSYNSTVPPDYRVKFVGFDIHYNNEAKQKVLGYLKQIAPDRVRDTEALFEADLDSLMERAYFTKSEQERTDIIAKLAGARTKYDELLGFLTLNEVRFANRTSFAEFRNIGDCARVLAQVADAYARPLDEADGELRDYYMAENIRRLLDAEPKGTRAIVWAHNGHISAGYEGGKKPYPHMGFHLRRYFGDAYYAVGLSFNQGSFQARVFSPKGSNSELMQFAVGPAREESIDWYFARLGTKNYFVDIRHAPKDDRVIQWLSASHPMRSIGSYYNPQTEKNYFAPTILKQEFDGIVFFDQTKRARPNPSVRNVVGMTSEP
jgi:erythromycin esterase